MVFIPSSHLDDPEGVKRMYSPPVGSINWQLDAVARRDRRIAELNAPPQPAAPEADTAPETPAAKPRKLTELQRAKTWLADVLSGERMLATTVEKLAVNAGISKRTLRRASKALKVKIRKNGRGPWFWSMVRTGTVEGQGAKVTD